MHLTDLPPRAWHYKSSKIKKGQWEIAVGLFLFLAGFAAGYYVR